MQRDKLLEAHPLDEEGTWEIRGEDPNCDWGGHHHEPQLAIVSGRYGDVVEQALKLPRFFTWGAGGRIIKVEVVTPAELPGLATAEKERQERQRAEAEARAAEAAERRAEQERDELLRRRRALIAELAGVEKQLGI